MNWYRKLKASEDQYLYHTTYFSNMPSIVQRGLVPRSGAGTYNHGGYGEHSQGKVFFGRGLQAAQRWFDKIYDIGLARSDFFEEQVPVTLRIPLRDVLVDDIGSRDVPDSFYSPHVIPPQDIEYWDAFEGWTPVVEWNDRADLSAAVSREDESEDGGDPIRWTFTSDEEGGYKPPFGRPQ